MAQKAYQINNFFCHHHKTFLLKNTFKVTLQYLINVFILTNTVSYIKFNFKLKIGPEICSFKNLEEILKTLKKLTKYEWQPCVMYSHIYYFYILF